MEDTCHKSIYFTRKGWVRRYHRLKKEKENTTKNGGVRPRFFGPRFKKRGPKQPKAPFYTRGLSPGVRLR